MNCPLIRDLLATGLSPDGEAVVAKGWFRYLRKQSHQVFGHLYDGSCFTDLQCVFIKADLEDSVWQSVKGLDNGSSVEVTGVMVESPAKGQDYELKATGLVVHGQCDMSEYPLVPKKGFTLEYYRQFLHLRSRARMIQCIMRIRSTLDFAIHEFFQREGYLRLHSPLITASDCEGAGETFEVGTLSLYKRGLEHEQGLPPPKDEDERKVREAALEARKLFFGVPAYLTVSGQLDAEAYACGMGRVYTFGPTFRAETSNTYRHLSEFWMIEPEMAFMELAEDMQVAQLMVQFCLNRVLERHQQDLEFLEQKQDDGVGLRSRLQKIVDCQEFPRVSYTHAIDLLQAEVAKGVEFEESDIRWGMDLASEHEKHLVSVCYQGQPIIVHGYPSEIKAFYMHENELDDEGRATVAAMDMLVPGIGELVGGSQREIRVDVLEAKMKKVGLEVKQYREYLDLRKYGNVPHSGFGLGFERLVMLATATHHIRDVIPFPRAAGLI